MRDFIFSSRRVSLLLGLSLLATGCNQEYTLELRAPASTSQNNGGGANPGSGGSDNVRLASATQSFNVADSGVKKIDFLFVVDNSGSMEDNQARLAAGFEQFANTFYMREDLDICTAIITSDRYLGRNKASTYSRERIIPCTKTPDWSSKSDAQKRAHIEMVIAEFKSKVNVGVTGNSGIELLGKSLVPFLYNIDKYGDAIVPGVRTAFFRPDAVANISFVTDENNWFFKGATATPEAENDLPPVKGAAIYNAQDGSADNRDGIKDHLDSFFNALRPGQGLSYSVTSIQELNQPATQVPGTSMNLFPLPGLVGRESKRGDISAEANDYANLYQSISEAIVLRAGAFSVNHAIYEPGLPGSVSKLKVTLVRANGQRLPLSYSRDFTVLLPNGINLDVSVVNSAQPGDRLEVEYSYRLP